MGIYYLNLTKLYRYQWLKFQIFLIPSLNWKGGRMKWDYNSENESYSFITIKTIFTKQLFKNILEPAEWARLFPICNGRSQSPINIDPKLVVKHPQSIPEFNFLNYDEIIPSFVFNNGHSCI